MSNNYITKTSQLNGINSPMLSRNTSPC